MLAETESLLDLGSGHRYVCEPHEERGSSPERLDRGAIRQEIKGFVGNTFEAIEIALMPVCSSHRCQKTGVSLPWEQSHASDPSLKDLDRPTWEAKTEACLGCLKGDLRSLLGWQSSFMGKDEIAQVINSIVRTASLALVDGS
jgi:hypothetical protein